VAHRRVLVFAHCAAFGEDGTAEGNTLVVGTEHKIIALPNAGGAPRWPGLWVLGRIAQACLHLCTHALQKILF